MILRHIVRWNKDCIWRLKKKERPIPDERIGLGREIIRCGLMSWHGFSGMTPGVDFFEVVDGHFGIDLG